MTTTPNAVERCSPSCPHSPAHVIRDADGLRPAEAACLVHLGTAVAKFALRYGAVVVELHP